MGIYQGLEIKMLRSGAAVEEHWHPDIDVIFVVEGSARATVQGKPFEMGAEDILLVNSSLTHSISCQEGALLCLVQFPWRMVSDLLGSAAFVFRCNSAADKMRSYHDLRNIFRSLVYYFVHEQQQQPSCLLESQMLRLLDCLVRNYLLKLDRDAEGQLSDEERLQRIFQYVNQNYQDKVGLAPLASEMFVSTSTLSRFFKKQTGMGFLDYLVQVRIHAAAMALERTDENITRISVNCGFSNLSVFNRTFREHMGVTPSEYRRTRREERRLETESQRESLEHLREHLKNAEMAELIPPAQTERKRRYTIRADGQAGTLYQKNWNEVINIGPMYKLTQARLQNHVLSLAQELGYYRIRLWDVLSQWLTITDVPHPGEYNFELVDSVLDFLVSNRLRPFLDFANRANAITLNEHMKLLQERAYIQVSSRAEWEHLIRAFIRHIVNRYGQAEANQWTFELTYFAQQNNLEACYPTDGPFRFQDAFCYFFTTVKKYLPQAEVGAFGAVPDWRPEFQLQFLKDCREAGCAPDFFSIIVYPYVCDPADPYPVPHRSSIPGWERIQIQQSRQLMKEAGLENCKLVVSEWNCTVSNRNYLNDSAYRGAYLAQELNSFMDLADLVTVSIGSDWVGNHFDTYRVASGNMGLLTQAGIRKPAFFAIQFLNMLGDYLITRGENYIVTRTGHGSYYILCFNEKHFNSSWYLCYPTD